MVTMLWKKYSNPIEITTENVQSTLIPIGFPQEVIHLRKRDKSSSILKLILTRISL